MATKLNCIGELRNIDESEVELILSWRNEPNVRENMYTTDEISLDEHKRWWMNVQGRSDKKYLMYEADGQPFGVVGFTSINELWKNSSWAFYASPNAKKGTGSRMEFLALEYAFKILNLHKLYCEVLEFNTSVIKMHQKFGFNIEGILKEHYRNHDKFYDIYCLGITSSQWSDKQVQMENKILGFK